MFVDGSKGSTGGRRGDASVFARTGGCVGGCSSLYGMLLGGRGLVRLTVCFYRSVVSFNHFAQMGPFGEVF